MIRDLIQHPALITHLTGFSNYSKIYYQDRPPEVASKTLLYFQERLPYFLRTHKTALINPYYIQGVQIPPRCKMAGTVSLWDGSSLPVGRRRWGELTRSLAQMDSPLTGLVRKYSQSLAPLAKESSGLELFVLMQEGLGRILLGQLVAQIDPQWQLRLFSSPLALQQGLVTTSKQTQPRLLLLEGGPGLATPLALLSWIRARFKRLPIVLTTSWLSNDLLREGYALGANSIIVQPHNELQFLKVFEQLLQYWLYMASIH